MKPLLPGAASKETEQLPSLLESLAARKGFGAAPLGAGGLAYRLLQPLNENRGEGGLLKPLLPGAASKETEQLPSLLESQAGTGGLANRPLQPLTGDCGGGGLLEPLLPRAASKETYEFINYNLIRLFVLLCQ